MKIKKVLKTIGSILLSMTVTSCELLQSFNGVVDIQTVEEKSSETALPSSAIEESTSRDSSPTDSSSEYYNKLVVIFDAKNGDQIITQKCDYYSLINKPTDPYKEGYTFMGWSYNDKLWDFNRDLVKENMQLDAMWTINIYSITIDFGIDGYRPYSKIAEYGSRLQLDFDLPNVEGYTFIGWDEAIPTYMPAHDVYVTAKWEYNNPHGDIPESTCYSGFSYNYANKNMSVWTNEEINKSVAPQAVGYSRKDVSEYKTIGTFGEYGYYTFVIDANGFIEYASYGIGLGWGDPTEGKYHNQLFGYDYDYADYFVIGYEYESWPARTYDGSKAWELWDLVIPEGGFIITGWHDDYEFGEFWKQLFGEDKSPKLANISNPTNNAYLEAYTAPTQLDNFYVSINQDKKLEVRERTSEEMKDENGNINKVTPAINYEPTEEDYVVVYDLLSNVKNEFRYPQLDNTTTFLVKGVVTAIYDSNSVVIEDEYGNAITLYSPNRLFAGLNVGQTVAAKGTLTLYFGLQELKVIDLWNINDFGSVEMPTPIELNAGNVDEIFTVENQGKSVKLVKAQVLSIVESGISLVKLGGKELELYKVCFPDEVQVNDYVDIVGTITVYSNPQIRASIDNISRYYSVVTEINGRTEIFGAALGDTITLMATPKEDYVFDKWVKVVGESEEDFEGNKDYIIDVIVYGDAKYKAIYKYSAWNTLPSEYANVANITIKTTNADCGADAVSVITDSTMKFHTEGTWFNGAFNTSWRSIVVVDKDGKIAYAVNFPVNGYGSPSGTGYMSVYEDYTTNPAFNILEGYGLWSQEDPYASIKFEIVVPEGGFIIVANGTKTNAIIKALLGDEVTEWVDGIHNDKSNDVSKVRAYYDVASNQVKFFRDVTLDDSVLINATIYNTPGETINLSDYTIAIDEFGKIIFASRTSEGYGCPYDGFYHDGTYMCVPGERCGIFEIDSNFAPFPAIYNGKNAWTLYKIICQGGWRIITGTEEQMRPIVNKVFDRNEFELDQPLFENMTDGKYNNTIVKIAEIHNKYLLSVIKEKENTAVSFESFADDFNQANGVYTITKDPNYVIDGTKALKVTYNGSDWSNKSYATWGKGILVADETANGVSFKVYSTVNAKVAFCFGTGGVTGGPAYGSACFTDVVELVEGWNDITIKFADLYRVRPDLPEPTVQAGIIQFGIYMVSDSYTFGMDAGTVSIKGVGTFYVDQMVAVNVKPLSYEFEMNTKDITSYLPVVGKLEGVNTSYTVEVTKALKGEADATDEITWTSSNEAVATVDAGVVSVVGNGMATITATLGNFEKSFTVTSYDQIYDALSFMSIGYDVVDNGNGMYTLTATKANQNKNYALANDIDFTDFCAKNNFTPLFAFNGTWNVSEAYKGIFDGQGYAIKNISNMLNTVRPSENNSGNALFGMLAGTVKNLKIENMVIDTYRYSAPIAHGVWGATIENVYISIKFNTVIGDRNAAIVAQSGSAGTTVKNVVVDIMDSEAIIDPSKLHPVIAWMNHKETTFENVYVVWRDNPKCTEITKANGVTLTNCNIASSFEDIYPLIDLSEFNNSFWAGIFNFEVADEISILDISNSNSIELKNQSIYNYDSSTNYGSVIFKFEFEINSWDEASGDFQIHFPIKGDVWAMNNMIWLRSDLTAIRIESKQDYDILPALSFDNHIIEIGRLAIMDDDEPTGSYYCYLKVDGKIIDKWYEDFDYEKLENRIFLTGEENNRNKLNNIE